MATIEERNGVNGEKTYRVLIRKKGTSVSKTFLDKEDAKAYIFYKESILTNLDNFEVDISKMVTLSDIFSLKIKDDDSKKKRYLCDMKIAKDRLEKILGKDKFLNNLTYEDWLECTHELSKMDVYRGSVNESSKRKMSANTLRKTLAYASSCISHANNMGIRLENHPLQVIRSNLSNLMDDENDQDESTEHTPV